MAKLKKRPEENGGVPIAPMIDVVFLLLIYFMVSSTLEQQEADLSFQLPGTVEQSEPLDLPDEQIIEIRPDGQVVVNDYPYDTPNVSRLEELASMLTRFKEASSANKVEAIVTISPADAVSHGQIVKVMDACSVAGIEAVNFALGDDG
ncbi:MULTISPECIES: biopolymer transporter ExbD [unclassified Lentimonas]|uniref:ExbD/TolR family protein n=1 Tax=unclassified Lentimonas TaxID=2630993 RepID=UPI0013213131|nr:MULTISPECIES: biopolymer transporter ExbD [unclassified Lentimonas]CAA6692777.1 Biopolymer transport protein ExbD/TolR [Lentimonas sp. CC19]CAA6695054.1 Biopolymer transport protein ExbD/TolR [Lentimonas sp. CC10]CAA7069659.1 Biopolymer transport protein ExbD/TolR [Lentimonas sp. CC11]